jgi:hypothetical protein
VTMNLLRKERGERSGQTPSKRGHEQDWRYCVDGPALILIAAPGPSPLLGLGACSRALSPATGLLGARGESRFSLRCVDTGVDTAFWIILIFQRNTLKVLVTPTGFEFATLRLGI